MKSIKFSTGLEKICLFAFFETVLEKVEFPASLKVVAQGAFACCKSLKIVTLNEGLEILGTDEYTKDGGYWYGVFQGTALESVTLSTTLKRVEYRAFMNCERLKSITLQEGLEHIGDNCFSDSGISEILIPKTVKSIGESALTSLKYIEVEEGCQVNVIGFVG